MQNITGHKGVYAPAKQLGAGGNGEVWRATGPGGEVAIKLLKAQRRAPADAAPRFKREIETLRRLDGIHGVLPLLDVDAHPEASERHWFAMPLALTIRERL